MILVIDIGNTNVVTGLYEASHLLGKSRFQTHPDLDNNYYQDQIRRFLNTHQVSGRDIITTVLSGVVTPLISVFRNVILELTGKDCYVVDQNSFPELSIQVEAPEQVGTDRLVNVYAAIRKYSGDLVVIDSGTATTFDVVTAEREFLGG